MDLIYGLLYNFMIIIVFISGNSVDHANSDFLIDQYYTSAIDGVHNEVLMIFD